MLGNGNATGFVTGGEVPSGRAEYLEMLLAKYIR